MEICGIDSKCKVNLLFQELSTISHSRPLSMELTVIMENLFGDVMAGSHTWDLACRIFGHSYVSPPRLRMCPH